ncbi:hypothetical protein BUALT_Bualt18G0049200 [Buddleja alternifolia]|uniref:Retrotransposon gag domain-containing protein n=1 Tax=Buddleja alternifolia TaxID=168488 RepID=A0AAV6W4H3_9LAMI|nr:hypothetical protein BUALT_Bualt18G0049200 [Buddleja alternifolia]
MRKFEYHFASKRKYAKSVAHLFSIRQQDDENLRSFVDRFNDKALDVQGLTNEIKINLMINALKTGPFADALIRDHPFDIEELMVIAQKYIYAEEMNELKDRRTESPEATEVVPEIVEKTIIEEETITTIEIARMKKDMMNVEINTLRKRTMRTTTYLFMEKLSR